VRGGPQNHSQRPGANHGVLANGDTTGGVERKIDPDLPTLPPSSRETGAERRDTQARDQFSRTFADVLSHRYGGHWLIEWEREKE
jgi:hypothetical protein